MLSETVTGEGPIRTPMGLGGTAKKIQKLADRAEDLYERLNRVREDVEEVRGTVEETSERVERIDAEMEDQRAILEALAEQQGVDVEEVLTETAIEEGDDGE